MENLKKQPQMKVLIILITVFISTTSCKPQNKESNLISKKEKMENFNINEFLEKNPNKNQKNFILGNGDEVQQFTSSTL